MTDNNIIRKEGLMQNKINEGLHTGDLADLVLPLISIDEYVSKISKDSVVIGFYVHDKEAANDLNRFIQRSSVEFIDVEVSPAPDQHGYFLVFVEILNNAQIGKNVGDLLEEMERLIDISPKEFRMRVRKTDGMIGFTPKALQQALSTIEKSDKDAIMEFLSQSDLSNVLFEENRITLETKSMSLSFLVVGFGDRDSLMESLMLSTAPIKLCISETLRTNRLGNLLGAGWEVLSIEDYQVLTSPNGEQSLILSKI